MQLLQSNIPLKIKSKYSNHSLISVSIFALTPDPQHAHAIIEHTDMSYLSSFQMEKARESYIEAQTICKM